VFGADASQETEADVTGIPAVRDPSVKGVWAGLEEAGDVVGVIVSALTVIGPTGCEIGVADALAVEVKFVDAESCGVDGGAADGFSVENSLRYRWAGGSVSGLGFFGMGDVSRKLM
jgi:hypothetical protein